MLLSIFKEGAYVGVVFYHILHHIHAHKHSMCMDTHVHIYIPHTDTHCVYAYRHTSIRQMIDTYTLTHIHTQLHRIIWIESLKVPIYVVYIIY